MMGLAVCDLGRVDGQGDADSAPEERTQGQVRDPDGEFFYRSLE